MRSFEALLRGLTLVGQVGICVITPPLILGYLAWLLVTRHGWGSWIVVAALLVGLISGLCSAWSLLRPKKEADRPRKTTHFDDHR